MNDLDCTNLFVYGTLRSPFGNEFARLLSQKATFLGKARIRGRLYRFHNYPAVRLTWADERVTGEVYALDDPASVLAILDDYEGCGPKDDPPHEFERGLTTATMESGMDLCAWVYVYNWPTPEERRVFSGDFLDEG